VFNGEVLRVLTGNDEQETEHNFPYASTAGAIMGKATSKMIVPKEMVKHARQILEEKFDKEYADQKGFGY
jgi:hypothetical protein